MIALLWILFFGVGGFGHGDHRGRGSHSVDAVEKIEKSQKVLENFGGGITPASGYCPDCAAQAHPAERRTACAKAICDNKPTQPLNDIENDAIRKAPQVDVRAEAAKLDTIVKTWWSEKVKETQVATDALRKFNGTATTEQKRLAAFSRFFSSIDKLETHRPEMAGRVNLKITIDAEKSAAQLRDLSYEQIGALKEMAEEFYARPYQESLQISSYPLEVVIKEKYPNMSRLQSFQREVEITEKALRDLEANPEFKNYAVALGAANTRQEIDFAALAKEQNPSDEQFRALIKSRGNLHLLREVIDRESPMSKLATKFDTSEFFSAKNRERQLDRLTENAKQLADVRQRERAQDRYKARCLARLTYALQVLPNEKQITTAEQNAQAAIGVIENKILPKFSQPTREAATPRLRSTRFTFPPTAEKYRRSFNDFLDQTAKVTASENGFQGDYALAQALTPQLSIDERLGNFSGQCDHPQFAQRMVSDASYGANGSIQVGWGSTRDPQFGRFVLAHELGHRLNDIFDQIQMSGHSAKRRGEIRMCLQARHALDGRPADKYLSEDWADWIASEVAGTMGPSPWCWRIDFGGLADGSEQLSLIDHSGDGEHSPPFFRLVQMHRQSGRTLPPGCKQVLLEQNPMIAEHYDCGQPPPALPAGSGSLRMMPTGGGTGVPVLGVPLSAPSGR